MIFHTKMPYEVPNDIIMYDMYHEKRIEWNILVSACMPYWEFEEEFEEAPSPRHVIFSI